MKKFLCIAALAALCVPAAAADLQLKAPALTAQFPTTMSGAYYGLYTALAAGQAEVKNIPAGINAASLTTTQGEIGGVVGYRWASANAARFVDAECDIGAMNLNGNTAGLSAGGPMVVECGVRAGVPMAAFASLFPNLGLPNFPTLPIPTGVSQLSTQMYVGGAVRFEDISPNFGATSNSAWAISPALWVGMLQMLSNGTALDGRIEYIFASDKCIGPVACMQMDHRVMAKIGMLF
jgi:hypothetical protein